MYHSNPQSSDVVFQLYSICKSRLLFQKQCFHHWWALRRAENYARGFLSSMLLPPIFSQHSHSTPLFYHILVQVCWTKSTTYSGHMDSIFWKFSPCWRNSHLPRGKIMYLGRFFINANTWEMCVCGHVQTHCPCKTYPNVHILRTFTRKWYF